MYKNEQKVQFTVIHVQGNHVHLKEHLTCKTNFANWPEKGGSWCKQLVSTSPLYSTQDNISFKTQFVKVRKKNIAKQNILNIKKRIKQAQTYHIIVIGSVMNEKWKCVVFKCYSSEELITLNTLHEEQALTDVEIGLDIEAKCRQYFQIIEDSVRSVENQLQNIDHIIK